MNKKIYILIVLVLALNVSFGQNISPVGQDSLKYYIYQFGQLCDLSSVGRGVKQSSPRSPERNVAAEFANLFRAYTIDTNRVEKDSLVIVPFLDPRIRLFDCYKIKNDSGTILRKAVDSCLNEKKSGEFFPKVSINQFIDTVYKFYSQTISDINQNDIQILFDDIQHVHGKRYQVVAQAPLAEFRGSIDVNYSPEIGTKYEYKADIQKKDQLSFNLRFYLSYDKVRNTETRFKIDSVTMIKPTGVGAPPLKFTKARGYLEPYFNFGLSFINLNSEDVRFDNLNEGNNFLLSGGVNATFFFNNRRFSKWDLGFTTGVGYKSLRSTYSIDSYIDTLAISDDYTAQELGGTYDLYVDAKNLEQQNKITVLEVPLQFTAYYNFNKKRNLGLYSRLGGVFNLILSNDHSMEDGSVTYTGHIKKFINGEPTHYYFNSDIPEYGFSTYKADVGSENDLALNNFYISGRVNVGVFGTNKIQTIGWHIGTFFDIDFTDMLAADHTPATSLTRGHGNMDSFYSITDQLFINNWGVEVGITIQLFHENIKYRKTK